VALFCPVLVPFYVPKGELELWEGTCVAADVQWLPLMNGLALCVYWCHWLDSVPEVVSPLMCGSGESCE